MSSSVALELARALRSGESIEAVAESELATAADVHRLAAAARAAVDWPLAGWKIGATSPNARRVMQTDEPFFGPVFAPRVLKSGASVALPAGLFGFECELALRLGADLPGRPEGYDARALAIAIDAVVPAIELVATRQRLDGMGNARRAAVDFGFNHALVLGAPLAPPPLDRLPEIEVVALVDGEERGRGTGREVLGHPLEALAWLTRQGVDLAAGQVVSTGTCTGIAKLLPGQEARARFFDRGELLGEVVMTGT